MDIKKRYNQLNELILFVNKNKFRPDDPVFIHTCNSISFISRQINNQIYSLFYVAKKKKSRIANLSVFTIFSKINF